MSVDEGTGLVGGGTFSRFLGIRTKFHGVWLRHTYPFAEFGDGVCVHHSCEIRRSAAPEIRLGSNVYLAPGVWIDVDAGSPDREPKVILGSGCAIGRRSTISARNQVVLEADVLLAPSVLITDHEFSRVEKSGGRIFIGRNCWLGIGAVIACGSGDLNLGRNSVVAANAVVTQSFPAFSVIAGNPARVVKTYDQQSGKWVKPMSERVMEPMVRTI
ncbi:MAG: acyltransferase [Candidatus Sulfotelmatobacter sp.]|jgi:acetyltransferase-like isoleucine patch superfamily enzyme